jgi:hypothetical protein
VQKLNSTGKMSVWIADHAQRKLLPTPQLEMALLTSAQAVFVTDLSWKLVTRLGKAIKNELNFFRLNKLIFFLKNTPSINNFKY